MKTNYIYIIFIQKIFHTRYFFFPTPLVYAKLVLDKTEFLVLLITMPQYQLCSTNYEGEIMAVKKDTTCC